MLGSWSPGAFICPWEGGALPTADSGLPSAFHHSRSRPTPHSDYSARGRLTSLCCSEFPPSSGGVGPRENTHKSRSVVTQAGRQESAPVPGARGDSRALAQTALCRLRPRAVSQPVGDSLPHGDSLGHAVPGPPWMQLWGSTRLPHSLCDLRTLAYPLWACSAQQRGQAGPGGLGVPSGSTDSISLFPGGCL